MADINGTDPRQGPGGPFDAADQQHRMYGAQHRASRRGSVAGSTTFGPLRHSDEPGPDVDTCRICRGEGTVDEPLFYPCKCSGSIKYVHQDCLMEWLSHSQKKHCELCKTPFRFTKLYAPDMPTALPFHVFLTHLAKYLFDNVLVWLRAVLVASVWLGWLPYLMRSVWSFLFWISDEGLGGGAWIHSKENGTMAAVNDAIANSITSLSTSAVCPSSPLFAATTTPATVGDFMDRVSLASMPQVVKALSAINFTKGNRPYAALMRLIFSGAEMSEDGRSLNLSSAAAETAGSTYRDLHPSLLSQIGFLRNLTGSPSINRIIIAILEGQLITVAVVVCFILIILVRDYVVQQQPEINMRAAFAGDNEPAPQPPENVLRDVDVEILENLPGPNSEDEEAGERRGFDEEEADDDTDEYDGENRPGFDYERDVPEDELERLRQLIAIRDDQIRRDVADDRRGSEPQEAHGRITQQASHEALALQSEQQPGLDGFPELTASQEESSHVGRSGVQSDGELPGSNDFWRIHRAAGGDLNLVLEMIKEQGLEEKLEYYVRMVRWRLDRRHADTSTQVTDGSNRIQYPATPRSIVSQEGQEQDIEGTPAAVDKGKGRAADDSNDEDADDNADEDTDAPLLVGSPLRPRANTDGPKFTMSINPLANNSWSFADLPLPESSHEGSGWGFDQPNEPRGLQADSDSIYPTPTSSSVVAEDALEASEARLDGRGSSDWMEVAEMERVDEVVARIAGARALPARPQPAAAGLVDRVANFMWRNVDAIDPDEVAQAGGAEEIDVGDEIPFLAAPGQEAAGNGDAGLDREEIDDAIPAGLDADAIDDAEDLEGILELLGMRGPIAGLFQNAIFCAFLVSVTIFAAVFIPYNIGRITVWTIANPMRPVRMLLGICKFVQDVAVVCLGTVTGGIWYVFGGWWRLLSKDGLSPLMDKTIRSSWNMTVDAATRIARGFVTEMPIISAGEMRNFSALSHGALLTVKSYIYSVFYILGQVVMFACGGGNYSLHASDGLAMLSDLGGLVLSNLRALPQLLSDPSSWVINLRLPESTGVIDPELAYWGYGDRAWAILAGYATLSVIAALYLRRGVPFSTGQVGQEVEASVMDLLKQASGVMKVILIIGIEMLVFPFYCGLLLDVALLPLFEDATLQSRLVFTLNNPYTSCFVHWFVGTGYMFHFALFVSMCRKIMRKGVLYFIRDPDDPEFHPVRDVLERNVTTQLRKILFSAFVYGALVVVCLGGVVWGLAYSLPNVLPIHYSSNEPVLEFPIDLLFYNFLMPLAVRFFKPSDGLHAMYTWWFRKCARVLRITWFLFGDRKVDEEGTLALKRESAYENAPGWRKVFLEVDEHNTVVPKSWKDVFEGGTAKPTSTIPVDDIIIMNVQKRALVETKQMHPDGRFVRTPASDQIKIPKGKPVFLQVTERNTRLDGKPDVPDTDIYSTNQYQLVYVPPFFRFRVFLFILFIWIFAAVTGVGITIVPLIFGRHVFKLLIPAHIRTNDIYAFSIGVHILGSLVYAVLHARSVYTKAKTWLATAVYMATNRAAIMRGANVVLKAAKLVYAYLVLLVLFPFMLVSIFELYYMVPLHTFMYGAVFSSKTVPAVDVDTGSNFTAISIADINPKHTIRIVQAWTIGLLFMKLISRAITHYYEYTRFAAASHAVLRRGWLQPDVGILTRAFVVPGLAVWLSLVTIPLMVGRVLIAYGVAEQVVVGLAQLVGTHHNPIPALDALPDSDSLKVILPGDLDRQLADAVSVLIYRMSFPITQALYGIIAATWYLVTVFQGWSVRMRDEAYLIGERLHNFSAGNGQAQGRARGAPRT